MIACLVLIGTVVATDDAVAGYEYAYGVTRYGSAYGLCRHAGKIVLSSQALRELSVSKDGAVGNIEQFLPDREAKFCAGRAKFRHHGGALAGEIGVEPAT